ncbi:MAG: cytochrome C [Betaproteobacteria bacterium]|nr:MAG: cytochrome C [Betaproteobacteria bacterium]
MKSPTSLAFALASLIGFVPIESVFAQQQRPEKAARKEAPKALSAEAKRGKYLVQIGGCNDCHTPRYIQSNGKVDEKNWLIGDALGWRGPWGTTYPPNLRLAVQNLNEAQFMARARSELRPPMPWFNLRAMSDGDVKAIYAYLKHLGPAGVTAPAYLPPDKAPTLPFVQFPSPPPAKTK